MQTQEEIAITDQELENIISTLSGTIELELSDPNYDRSGYQDEDQIHAGDFTFSASIYFDVIKGVERYDDPWGLDQYWIELNNVSVESVTLFNSDGDEVFLSNKQADKCKDVIKGMCVYL